MPRSLPEIKNSLKSSERRTDEQRREKKKTTAVSVGPGKDRDTEMAPESI